MNILVINGSPKGEKSNTYRLTQAFLEGISAHEESIGNQIPKTETLEINKLNVKSCLGCFPVGIKRPVNAASATICAR